MSGAPLVLSIVAAVLLAGLGLQATARQFQRHPVDVRGSGPLIDVFRSTTLVVRPAELEQLNSLVAESLASEGVARAKLDPLLDELERGPRRASTGAGRGTAPRRAGRRSRGRDLDARLTELEEAWGLAPQ